LSVGTDNFYFLLSLVNFHEDIGEWPENQILIPDWTYFHCPAATLVADASLLGGNKSSKPLAIICETLTGHALNQGGPQ